MNSPYMLAEEVCEELRIDLAVLKRMSRRGEYPDLLHIERGKYRVLRANHEAWCAGRTTSAIVARAELMLERARAELMGGA